MPSPKRHLVRNLLGGFVALLVSFALLFALDPGTFIYRGATAIGIPVELEPQGPLADGVKWHDDYYTVEYLDPQTIAIGEPRYYQKNVSYLIIGEERAVLFDTGPGIKEIDQVVRSLTSLPVTSIASHLHYDHVGNMGRFPSVAMLDLPHLRAQVDAQGVFAFGDAQHLGAVEKNAAPKVKVNTWLKSGEAIDLGGRSLKVVATPGHTDDSMMLYDEERKQLFTGDYIYPGHLLAILPGARIGAYLDTSTRLAETVAPETVLYPGHASATAAIWQTPRLARQDLLDLNASLQKLKRGEEPVEGVFPRQIKVNERITLLLPFDWNLDWN